MHSVLGDVQTKAICLLHTSCSEFYSKAFSLYCLCVQLYNVHHLSQMLSAQPIRSIYLSILRTTYVHKYHLDYMHTFSSSTAFLFRSTICPFISQKYTIVFEIQSNEFSNCTMKYVNTFSAQISERKKQSLL